MSYSLHCLDCRPWPANGGRTDCTVVSSQSSHPPWGPFPDLGTMLDQLRCKQSCFQTVSCRNELCDGWSQLSHPDNRGKSGHSIGKQKEHSLSSSIENVSHHLEPLRHCNGTLVQGCRSILPTFDGTVPCVHTHSRTISAFVIIVFLGSAGPSSITKSPTIPESLGSA